MSDTEIELGPIDWVIVEWPPGKEPNGKGLDMIVDLTERGIIRVLDIAFVRKNEDGSVSGGAIGDFDADGTLDLALFEGASSGVLGQEDYDEAGTALEAGRIGGDPRLREHVGGAVRDQPPQDGRTPRRQRTHSDQRVHRRARRARSGRGLNADDRREQHTMPLVRMAARTAVVAGTATAVSGRVARRQENKWAEQEAQQQYQEAPPPQQAPPPPAATSTDDKLEQLKQLGELKTAGVLTDAEFEAQKAKILAG